jgi:HicB family
MSTLSLRLPESLHDLARKLAKEERISINQLITLALAEKIWSLQTERFFKERAKGSSRAKFERAMAKVAKVEPPEYDRWRPKGRK